jgi:hypothetical protein
MPQIISFGGFRAGDKQLVTCRHCGTVHMGVSREEANGNVLKFNLNYRGTGAEPNGKGPATIDSYLKCCKCGISYVSFRVAKEGDAPDNTVIQSILHFSQ